jgi:hypothetical protein
MSDGRVNDRERRKLFRRMEWVLVYAPPLLAVFFAVFGGFFIAAIAPIPGTTFWGRWALVVLIVLVIPAIVYTARAILKR